MEVKIISVFLYLLILFLPICFALGMHLMDKHYRKFLKDYQCKNCKHFNECKGFWRVSNKETGICKIYQKREQDFTILKSLKEDKNDEKK